MSRIEQIKGLVSITDVLEKYTDIQWQKFYKGRKSFNINCPFHQDRRPSCTVYLDSNKFRCWVGCNKGKFGDVIDFVCLYKSIGVKEALRIMEKDFELTLTNDAQNKEWRIKKAHQQKMVSASKELENRLKFGTDFLITLEKYLNSELKKIRTTDDMKQLGALYHVNAQVDFWLDCLMSQNPVIQTETLLEIEEFIKSLGQDWRRQSAE